jgi:hypothetical protein
MHCVGVVEREWDSAQLGVDRGESSEGKGVESGEWRVESGEWRVRVVFLPVRHRNTLGSLCLSVVFLPLQTSLTRL